MLKLRTVDRAHRSSRLSAETELLGVTWLNGELSVCAEDGNKGMRSWSAPNPVGNVAEIGKALQTAVENTGFAGRRVSLLIAHAQLVQTFLEVPLVPEAMVRRLVERQVERHKPFPGQATWYDQPGATTRNGAGRILHMLPRELHDGLVSACREADLHLATLTPVSEAVRQLAPAGRANPSEPLLIAALIPGALVLTLCQQDGKPFLLRTVTGAGIGDPERLAVEIRRTQIFARQQFQLAVEEVWLAGPALENEAGRRLTAAVGEAHWVSGDFSAGCWARWAMRPNSGARVNLITRAQERAPHRRAVSLWSRTLGLATMLITFGMALFVERIRVKELAEGSRLIRVQAGLTEKAGSLRTADEVMQQRRALVEAWEQISRPPLSLWLPGCLAQALPKSLVLTNLEATAITNGWRLRLGGCAASAGSGFAKPDVDLLRRALLEGPIALILSEVSSASPLGRITNAVEPAEAWTRRLQESPGAPTPRLGSFLLEGTFP